MSHKHHDHCDHSLKWCRDCRAAYCTKCPETFRTNAEWARDRVVYHEPWQITYSNTPLFIGGHTVGNAETPLDITPTITCQHQGA